VSTILIINFAMTVTSPEYVNCPELIENIGENYQYWKRQLAEEERSQADATKSNEEAADPETSTAVKESEEKT
jgi:hypothetical protein